MTDLTAIAERFARETATHVAEVLHDDGLYRHIRCQGRVWRPPIAQPSKTSFYWFEIITAPGSLTFRGDGDSFVFARIEDMFEFFRGQRVNPSYWAEKVTSGSGGRDSVMSYSREVFDQHVAEAIADADDPDAVTAAIQAEIRDWHDVEYEANARQLLDQFEHDGFRFYDTWEWNLRDYDWWFLWALHAIVWAIGQYDQAKGQCRYDVAKLFRPLVSLRKAASSRPLVVTASARGGVL